MLLDQCVTELPLTAHELDPVSLERRRAGARRTQVLSLMNECGDLLPEAFDIIAAPMLTLRILTATCR